MEYKNTEENMAAQRLSIQGITCLSRVNAIEGALMKPPGMGIRKSCKRETGYCL